MNVQKLLSQHKEKECHMSNKIECKASNKHYIVFSVQNKLIDFEKMRHEEGLSSRKLSQALADRTVEPLAGRHSLCYLQEQYDGAPNDTAGETAILKAIALQHYTTDSFVDAQTPILDFGRDSERRMLPFHNEQKERVLAGGPSGVEVLLSSIAANRRRCENKK
jgi:hypothetical protein